MGIDDDSMNKIEFENERKIELNKWEKGVNDILNTFLNKLFNNLSESYIFYKTFNFENNVFPTDFFKRMSEIISNQIISIWKGNKLDIGYIRIDVTKYYDNDDLEYINYLSELCIKIIKYISSKGAENKTVPEVCNRKTKKELKEIIKQNTKEYLNKRG